MLPPAPAGFPVMSALPADPAAAAAAGSSPAVAAAVANLGLQMPTEAMESGPWWDGEQNDEELSYDEDLPEAEDFSSSEVEPLLTRAPTVARSASASPVLQSAAAASAPAGAGVVRTRSAAM